MPSLARGVALAEEELRITEPNVAAGVTSRVELLRLQRDATELRGDLDAAGVDISDQAIRDRMAEALRTAREEVYGEDDG